MRRIVAGLFISVDGVIESPEKWHFPYYNDEMAAVVEGQMAKSDCMLLGRQTYQEFAGFWPSAEDDFAGFMNNTPKYVVTTTLETAEWQNTTIMTGDIAAELTALKQQPGKDIAITGSATLVASLLRMGLLDELILLVHPIVVGSGKRLFQHDGETVPLRLVDATPFKTGVVCCTYQRGEES